MELEQQRPLDAVPSGTAKDLKAAQLQFMRELRKVRLLLSCYEEEEEAQRSDVRLLNEAICCETPL